MTLVTGGGVVQYHAALNAVREGMIGARFGDYRATRIIGEGGMSVVFEGERADGQFNKTVAIKVIGQPAGDEWVDRTSHERQILADLSHPGIAQLFDAGVNDAGYSFIVMEHVPGVAIDRFVQQTRSSIGQRLGYFSQVLAALDHAHQRSIVHGDIKPSNILVSTEGQVKLLDFGIGHFLSSSAGKGSREVRALTPTVASPEQLLGKPLTHSADIYQLGLLLYGLLTERMPYSGQSYEEARQRVTEYTLPSPPSEAVPVPLGNPLRGDLDAIVAECLAFEPQQRYASVSALANDIQRYRDHRPVSARPLGLAGRSARFIRRNRVVVGIATAGMVALTMLSATYLKRVDAERERVALEATKVDDLNSALTDVIRSLSPFETGRGSQEAESALTEARNRIESALAGQEALQPGLLHALAKAEMQMGAFDSAESNLLRALELGGKHLTASQLAIIQSDYGQLLNVRERWEEAEQTFSSAWAQLSGDDEVDSRDKAHLLSGYASIRHGVGDLDGAIDFLDEARELAATDFEGSAPLLAHINAQLASILNDRNQPSRALPLAQEAKEQFIRHYGTDHPALLQTLNVLAVSYGRLGDHQRAEQTAHQAIDLLERDVAGREDVLQQILVNLSVSLYRQRKYQPALEALDKASAAGRSVAGAAGQAQAFVALSRSNVLNRLGRFEEAQQALEEAERVLLANGQPQSEIMGRVRNAMAASLVRRGRFTEAIEASRSAVELKSRHSGPESRAAAESRLNLARGLIGAGQLEQAFEELDLAWNLLTPDQADASVDHPRANVVAGELAMTRGELDLARQRFSQALATWEQRRTAPHEDIAYGHFRLGELHWRIGDATAAFAQLQEAVRQYDAIDEVSIDATTARLLLARLQMEEGLSVSVDKPALQQLIDQVPQRTDWRDHWSIVHAATP